MQGNATEKGFVFCLDRVAGSQPSSQSDSYIHIQGDVFSLLYYYLCSVYLPTELHVLLWPLALATPTSLNLAACSQTARRSYSSQWDKPTHFCVLLSRQTMKKGLGVGHV